jgi:hypothetical protein
MTSIDAARAEIESADLALQYRPDAIESNQACGWKALVTPVLDDTGRVRSTPTSPILARAMETIDSMPDSKSSDGTIPDYETDDERYFAVEEALQSARSALSFYHQIACLRAVSFPSSPSSFRFPCPTTRARAESSPPAHDEMLRVDRTQIPASAAVTEA